MRSIIYGAGSFGHELAEFICDSLNINLDKKECIFFVDNWKNAKSENIAWKLCGSLDEFNFQESDKVYIGFGDPLKRHEAFISLKKRGIMPSSFIHPTAYLSKDCQIMDGSIISPFCTVGFKSKLNCNVLLNTYVAVGHHVEIGESSVISPKTLLAGKAEVGERCFLGSGSIITPSKKVGDNASVGAGSVVYRNVKEGTKVFGNPAKKGF